MRSLYNYNRVGFINGSYQKREGGRLIRLSLQLSGPPLARPIQVCVTIEDIPASMVKQMVNMKVTLQI